MKVTVMLILGATQRLPLLYRARSNSSISHIVARYAVYGPNNDSSRSRILAPPTYFVYRKPKIASLEFVYVRDPGAHFQDPTKPFW